MLFMLLYQVKNSAKKARIKFSENMVFIFACYLELSRTKIEEDERTAPKLILIVKLIYFCVALGNRVVVGNLK